MHSRDPAKDKTQFRQEIDAILDGTSKDHRPKDRLDFSGFVFPEAYFEGQTFTFDAHFTWATFIGYAHFTLATFIQDAIFFRAKFIQDAIFSRTTFTQNADFTWATFTQNAIFDRTVFGPRGAAPTAANPSPAVANFASTQFEKPALVRFYQVNKQSSQGLRARFVDCEIEQMSFVDVNWHKQAGRMVLQNELDVTAPPGPEEAKERVRNYDLAEDCFIGAMEMRRLDPAAPWFSRAAVTLYRWASSYGSSYVRAVAVLGILLLAFGLLFALPWTDLHVKGPAQTAGPSWVLEAVKVAGRGLFHSLEVATFRPDTAYVTTKLFGRLLGIFESVVVPSQLALLLLALRRRFRR
jgi:hypothetical protein